MSEPGPIDVPPLRTPDAAVRTPSNLRLRMIASVVMIAVATGALMIGGIALWVLACVIALLMMAEWAVLVGAAGRIKRIGQFALAVPLALMAPASLLVETHYFFTLGLLAGAAFFTIIITRLPMLGLGIVYCGLPVLALVVLREQPAGLLLAFWMLSLVWACDIGAFATGRTLGGPKLSPRLSPNKTWSGLIGGVTTATLLALLLWLQAGLPLILVAATPLLAILSQGGDLFESGLKRRAGVKDSGNILPGHGGLLDRLDGLVPVAPVATLLALFVAAL